MNMTATHDLASLLNDREAPLIMENIKIVQAIPTGWLCPRCGAVNAPDVKRCECEPGQDDLRRGILPNTAVGPSEVK